MVRWVLLVAIVACAVCANAIAGDATQAKFTATIIAMRAVTGSGDADPVETDLRVDVAENGIARPGQLARVRCTADQRPQNHPRLGLGDQLRMTAELSPAPGADGIDFAGAAAGPIEYLGRGEFVNPGEKPVTDRGSPKAKVLVKLLAPVGPECHQKTSALLVALATQHPDQLRLQIFDMFSPAGRAEMTRERLNCATVLVNNRHDFQIEESDRLREVQFVHRPNAPNSSYQSEDVVTVVTREIARLYPGENKE